MQWLNELPFADNRVFQIGFLAACGIAALIVLAIFYRLAFANRLRIPGGRTRQPRLGLVDAFSLDGQRQLVLVRRDNVEHLVMIGGPNDVLVESQINRAAVSAREASQPSPLLVPSAPARRTEAAAAPAAPEPPLKVAAKTPTAPPTPAAVAPLAPAAAPTAAKASAPAAAQAAAAAPASKPSGPEQPRAAPAPPTPTQAAEPARPAPASSPPRPSQPRPAMPPPIIPGNAPANRAAAVRPTETAPKAPGNPPASSQVAPAMPPRPDKQADAAAKTGPAVSAAKAEPRAAPSARPVPPASAASAEARPEPKTPPPAPASDGAPKFISPARPSSDNGTQKSADVRPPTDNANAAPNAKPPAKVDDPFGDLDSLEAEMARLLGREKPD